MNFADSLLLFVATLVQVFMIAMQSIQIIKNQPLKAALCASFVAASNVVIFKMVPQASMDTLLTYVSANAIGVPLAMYFGQRNQVRKEKELSLPST